MEISKISGTLEKGRFYSGGLVKLLYFSIVICILAMPLTILVGFANVETEGLYNVLWVSILAIIFEVGFAGMFLYLIKKNNKLKKEIQIYLQDAMLLEAQTEDIGGPSISRRFYDGTKIRIAFRYEGKTIIK